MATRNLLHKDHLEKFKVWLVGDGWTIEKTVGAYEVLRARKPGREHPLIIYTKAGAKEHYTVMARDFGVVQAFLKAQYTIDMREQIEEVPQYHLVQNHESKIELSESNFANTGTYVVNKRSGKKGVVLREWKETGQVQVLESVEPFVVCTHGSWQTLEVIDF